MKVVVDNNVIIDALKPNPQFEGNAQEILRLAFLRKIEGYVSANSLTDIFYVLRKTHGSDKTKIMLQKLLLFIDIIGNESLECNKAFAMTMSDFEDAMVAVCAEKVKADYIVTRDENFIKSETKVKAVTPEELMEKLTEIS